MTDTYVSIDMTTLGQVFMSLCSVLFLVLGLILVLGGVFTMLSDHFQGERKWYQNESWVIFVIAIICFCLCNYLSVK